MIVCANCAPRLSARRTEVEPLLKELRAAISKKIERVRVIVTIHLKNEKVQSKVDALSMRSQGRPKEAKDGTAEDVFSEMNGTFRLSDGLLSFPKLHSEVPRVRGVSEG